MVTYSGGNIETLAAYGINAGKNALVNTIGNAAIGYTSGSIGMLYINSQVIPNTMNNLYSMTIGNPVVFAAIWQVTKGLQGVQGMQNPLIKP